MSTVAVRSLLHAADTLGIEAEKLLDEVGLDELTLRDREARLPEKAAGRLWDKLERSSGDPAFGLRIAEVIEPRHHGLVGYLCSTSDTLGDALDALAQYAQCIADSLRISVQKERDRIRVRIDADQWTSRHGREAAMALLVLRARRLVGRSLVPREVRFRHARPPELAVHRRIFDAPVLFMQRADELVVDRAALDLPLPSADPTLREILQRHADLVRGRNRAPDGLVEQMRRAVEDGLRTHDVGLPTLARRLHLSPRTLQRRLSSEGTSLHALVDQIRRDLALKLLESDVPIAEAAYLLGFSEASAFHRAFKRWTGRTPAQHRARK